MMNVVFTIIDVLKPVSLVVFGLLAWMILSNLAIDWWLKFVEWLNETDLPCRAPPVKQVRRPHR